MTEQSKFELCKNCHICDCLPDSLSCEHCECARIYNLTSLSLTQASDEFVFQVLEKTLDDLTTILCCNVDNMTDSFSDTNRRVKKIISQSDPLPQLNTSQKYEGLYFLNSSFPKNVHCHLCQKKIQIPESTETSEPYYLKNGKIYHAKCFLGSQSKK